MKSLREIGLKFGTGKVSGHSYVPTYEKYLGLFHGIPFNLLELGVLHGESIAMWLEWLPHATIYGVDAGPVTPSPNKETQPELDKWLGNSRFIFKQQAVHEPGMATLFPAESMDVIIDDASHDPDQVTAALDMLWPVLKPGGLYFIEDVYSSRTLPRLHGWSQQHKAVWKVVANFENTWGEFRDDDILVILRKSC